ncbi:MAG TPA: SRPBCC family protein [Flavitalea sp.]|nr:SRPBCC family protein [Flavitalea sp.]
MDKPVVEKSIEINASIEKVWRVFTDPVLTRHMGGEYLSDWKVGSSFQWKGKDGNLYTNGIILQIQPTKILKHNLFDLNDKEKLLSVITYEFSENAEKTVLTSKEVLNYELTKEQLQDASDGWDFALKAVKDTAESIETK